MYPAYRRRDLPNSPTRPVKRSVPVAARLTPAPRRNSCAIVVAENAHNAKHRPELQTRTPNAYSAAAVSTAAITGKVNC